MDKPLFFDSRVRVTVELATLDGVSYPIRAISSLAVREVPNPNGWVLALIKVVGWSGLALGALGLLGAATSASGRDGGAEFFAFLFAVSGGLRIWAGSGAKAVKVYALAIGSAGGERQALVAKDVSWVTQVRMAIEEAMRYARHKEG